MGINISTDFEKDYKRFVLNSISKNFNIDLENKNYAYLKDLKPQDLYFKFLSNAKRIPFPKSRNVHISKELLSSNLYKIYEKRINNIKSVLEKGETIRPFLNKDVKNIYKKNCPKDFLLNDWDLYHLHLGELKPNANFCDRTKYVLFCKFTENDAYFIQILDHTQKNSFACRKLLTILGNNWPNQFNAPKVPVEISLKHELTEEENRKLREMGINTFINIDGECYFSPNMGITSRGDSIKDSDIAMLQFRTLKVVQSHIVNNAKWIYDFIIRCDKRHKKPFKIFLKLKYLDDKLIISQDIYSKTFVTIRLKNNNITEMKIQYAQNTCIIKY